MYPALRMNMIPPSRHILKDPALKRSKLTFPILERNSFMLMSLIDFAHEQRLPGHLFGVQGADCCAPC
jgi:hypothetical protein